MSRGDLIVPVENLPYIGKEAEAMLCWMHETPMQVGKKYILKHTTHSTKAIISEVQYRVNIESLEQEGTSDSVLTKSGRFPLGQPIPLFTTNIIATER